MKQASPHRRAAAARATKGWLTLAEHPLATIVSALTIVAMIGAFGGWVVGTFVFKSDYMRDRAWHDYTHQNIRTERLTDEVDRMRLRKAVQGAKFPTADDAEYQLWQKKLEEANKKLEKAQDDAKAASK